MSLRKILFAQFGNPHGFLGRIAGWIMAKRPSNRERNSWTVDLLNIQDGDRIIEIGCGPGLALEGCLSRAGDGQVVGLDHSRTMLDQAQARNAEAIREGRLELRLGNLEGLQNAEGSFDKACSVNVVQFLPDPAAAFGKIFSILKSSGIAVTTYMPRGKNPNRETALIMAEKIKRHMKHAGFVKIRIDELPIKPAPAICVFGEHP